MSSQTFVNDLSLYAGSSDLIGIEAEEWHVHTPLNYHLISMQLTTTGKFCYEDGTFLTPPPPESGSP